MLKLTGKYRK